MCADISLFSSYQVGRTSSLLMGNGARAAVRGVGTVDLKLTSGKTVQLKNVQHVPSMRKNLISGSLLCRDGYKLVFESNKCILSKYGTFIGKVYESGGLFRLSLLDTCFNFVNHVSHDTETNIWHSRLCHINFGFMTRLAGMNLIPKFNLVKGSKCHVCVQSKQPRMPHKTVAARNLAPLELIHSDLCEMNGELTKGGKRYFMTLIDDCTRFYYVYLLKTKDKALHYFKIYKAEVENQLERKIKHLRSDRGEYFSNEFNLFCEEGYGSCFSFVARDSLVLALPWLLHPLSFLSCKINSKTRLPFLKGERALVSTLLLPPSNPGSSSCAHKDWKSRPPKCRCCPLVHLLGHISASGSAAGYIFLMKISIIYMFITFRSHMHISNVTNMFIFFWIKLLLKLPKFLTIQKRDRHFSVTGFAQMLKPNTFEGAHYKRWRQRCILWFTSMHCFFVGQNRQRHP